MLVHIPSDRWDSADNLTAEYLKILNDLELTHTLADEMVVDVAQELYDPRFLGSDNLTSNEAA